WRNWASSADSGQWWHRAPSAELDHGTQGGGYLAGRRRVAGPDGQAGRDQGSDDETRTGPPSPRIRVGLGAPEVEEAACATSPDCPPSPWCCWRSIRAAPAGARGPARSRPPAWRSGSRPIWSWWRRASSAPTAALP